MVEYLGSIPVTYVVHMVIREKEGVPINEELTQMGRLLLMEPTPNGTLRLASFIFRAYDEQNALERTHGILERRCALGEDNIIYSQLEVVG